MKGRGDERGIALLLVVVVTGLFVSATFGVVLVTSIDTGVASAFRLGLEAEYMAEAGLQRALAVLRPMPDWTPVLNGSVVSGISDGPPSGVRFTPAGAIVDLERVQSLATCGRVPCGEANRTAMTLDRPWGANNPAWRLFGYGPSAAWLAGASSAATPFYVVVLVADDPAETDGNVEVDASGTMPGAGIIRLHAEAFGPRGVRKVADAVAARAPGGGRIRVLQWRRASDRPF